MSGTQIGSTGGQTNTSNNTNNDENMSNNNSTSTADEKQANRDANNAILQDGIIQEGLRKDKARDDERTNGVGGTGGAGGGGPTILAIGASVADKTDNLFDKALASADKIGDDATPGDTIKLQAEYQLASSMSTAGSEIVKTTGASAKNGARTS